jgi:hypothetical protein
VLNEKDLADGLLGTKSKLRVGIRTLRNLEKRMRQLSCAGWVTALTLALLRLSGCSAHDAIPREPRYWMMEGPIPDNCVGIWLSESGNHASACGVEKVSPAAAFLRVAVIAQEVDKHEIHYHIRSTDAGLFLIEFVTEDSDEGEVRRSSKEPIHYHGIYVPLNSAEKLVSAFKSHQHGEN